MMKILQEQVKPTFLVFIAGRIDAVFIGFAMIFSLLVITIGSDMSILNYVVPAITFC